jgi:ribosomal protein S18 acetylase RimI-like enzyme
MFNTHVISETKDSLFAYFFRERENKETIFSSIDGEAAGFATYKHVDFGGPGFYIVDIYVKPMFRHKHVASKMADDIAEIARDNDCRWLWGSVDERANDPTASIKVLVGYGFDYSHHEGHMMYFKKDLEA